MNCGEQLQMSPLLGFGLTLLKMVFFGILTKAKNTPRHSRVRKVGRNSKTSPHAMIVNAFHPFFEMISVSRYFSVWFSSIEPN